MSILGMLGAGVLGGVVDKGLGMITGRSDDNRQVAVQGRLNAQQVKYQKELTDYNQRSALKMWEDTNYSAQVEQMKKAGINPGLLYGTSGAGGGTATTQQGSVQGGSASGAASYKAGMEIGTMTQAQQLMNLKAQEELTRAQTEQTKTETTKTAGVDTAEGEARIASLTQGIENAKATELLTKAETNLKNIEELEKNVSQEDRLDQITWEAKRAGELLQQAKNETYISNATLQEKIAIIEQTAIGAVIQNEATREGINLTKAQIAEIYKNLEFTDRTQNRQDKQFNNETVKTKFQMEMESRGFQRQGVLNLWNAVNGVLGSLRSTLPDTGYYINQKK